MRPDAPGGQVAEWTRVAGLAPAPYSQALGTS
jgi:hypothetical protein